MSGLFDQITNYSPPLLTAGQVNYKGTWDASANSPALVSPPAAISKGDYYVVSVAGTQFSITFAVGDWIISNGTAWEKVDLTDAVSSVFGRTGAVVGASTDYSSVGLTNTAIGASSPSTGAFTTVTASSTIAATGAVTGSNLSGTNTGDQTNITGNAATATALQTPRAINGVNFDGTSAITVTAAGSTLSDTVTIAKGGTGQITAQAALNALLPSQAGASGKNLQSDGTNVSFVADAGGTVTSVSVSTANGVSGTVATSTTTPAISLTLGAITPTSVAASGSVTGSNLSGTNTGDQTISITGDVTAAGSTGVLTASVTKINGTSLAGLTTGLLKNTTTTGVPTIAVSGTDYAPPTSGTAILYGNNAGGFNNVTVGSGLSFSSGTLASTSAGGSVTSVSVTTANGVSGTVTNPSSTPDISLTLGAITPSSVNSVVLSGSATPTLAVTGTSSISGTSSGTNTGDQTISITGDATASGSTGVLTATVSKINGTALSGLATGILKNTTTTGVPSIAVAADFPTLNQNTTGSAATLTTPRGIYGNNFDGSAALTQVIASTYGGTGNGFAKFSGPASSEKTFTLPNASSTLLYEGGTIGATTANTGAFTTLSASGVASFAAGTNLAPAISFSADSNTGFFNVAADTIGITTAGVYAGNFQTNSAGGGLYIQAGGTNQNIRLVPTGTGSVVVDIGGTITSTSSTGFDVATSGVVRGSFSSTGLAVTGALSSTTGANFATSSGSVGIGTASPAHPLDVINGGGTGISTRNAETNYSILRLGTDTGNAYSFIQNGKSGSGTTLDLAFRFDSSERMRITSAGLVGIGTSSPASKLQVTTSGAAALPPTSGTTPSTGELIRLRTSSDAAGGIGTIGLSTNQMWLQACDATSLGAYYQLLLNPNGGDVGIGTTSPGAKLDVSGNIRLSGANPNIEFNNGGGMIYGPAANTLAFATGGGPSTPVERARITSDGYLCLNTTSSPGNSYLNISYSSNNQDGVIISNTSTAYNGGFISFRNNSGGVAGVIIQATATTVLYTASSDYRLKNITGPLTDSGTFIDALKPKMGTWKEDGSKFVGFVAHEFAEVCPSAVTGEKDAVDEKGEPKYQSMQASSAEVIANLVAELQSLRQRVAALESN